MFDPAETEQSYYYLQKLSEKLAQVEWGVVGGWGVYYHVRQRYKLAFGEEYLKSRDIDVFVESQDEKEFLRGIRELGFVPGPYPFRYELIYDREQKKIIPTNDAKAQPLHNLIFIFLDVFSNRKTEVVGSWVFPELQKSKWKIIEGFPILNLPALLHLKVMAFFGREKAEKELKDACDIYALLFYSESKWQLTPEIRKAVQKMLDRPDLQSYIAEYVLKDKFKTGLIIATLRGIL